MRYEEIGEYAAPSVLLRPLWAGAEVAREQLHDRSCGE